MTEEINMSDVAKEIKDASEEDLRKIIEQHFDAVRTQGMKIGARLIATAIMDTIEKNLKNGMNSSHRDFERAIKRIIEILSVPLKQQETIQNDLNTEENIDDGTAE